MTIDLSSAGRKQMGIKFVNEANGESVVAAVIDKFPQMGDVHVEGRRYIEVSTEMFVELMALAGWHPVVPGELMGPAAVDPFAEFTEDEV